MIVMESKLSQISDLLTTYQELGIEVDKHFGFYVPERAAARFGLITTFARAASNHPSISTAS